MRYNNKTGTEKRFIPHWWQRRSYVEGLRDAQKIVEKQAWAYAKEGMGAEHNCRVAILTIQKRLLEISPYG